MHPADEFEAFKTLVEEGKSVEDVAARFGTSALTVRRRLKLASLHPVLLAQYREDRIALEQLMALALTDDQAEQLRIWEQSPDWQRDAASLRRMLVAQEIDAQRDPVAKLVGLQAYEAAGGAVRRDLFAEEGSGLIQDSDLLHRLADEKLQAAAESVRAEGWSWVDVAVRAKGSDLLSFGRCKKTRREMTKAEARKHAALSKSVEELDTKLTQIFGADDDSVDDDAISALEADAEAAREALEQFESALANYGPDAFSIGGAVVCVGREGRIEVHRGLIRSQGRRAASRASDTRTGSQDPTSDPSTESSTRPQHSAALRALRALKRLSLLWILLLAGVHPPYALAQAGSQSSLVAPSVAWPTRPVRLIVPFPPGAAPDVVARLVAERLAVAWSQPVVVENRPGAGGIPGMAALARSVPDGYTLGFVPAAAVALTPVLYRQPQFDVDKDVQPVATVGTSPMMVVVNSGAGVRTLADLVQHARSRRGQVNFAAPQPGSIPHLTGERLSRQFDLDLFTVPYSGSQAAVTAVLSGDALLTIDGLPALMPHVKAGKLLPLAVSASARLPELPSVPTIGESLPGFESVGWFALFAPRGLSASLAERINRDVQRTMADESLVTRLGDLGVYPLRTSVLEANAFVMAQRRQFKQIVDQLGLQPQ